MGLISVFMSDPIIFALISIALIFALCVHEFSHGVTAYYYGDDTAYLSGRLTLNPLAHLDPIGSLMILFIGFGYAKPVPVNPENLNDPRNDMIKVAAAGPISNFILSFIGILIFTALIKLNLIKPSNSIFFYYFIMINTYLGLFNLIPMYPLDGGQIFGNFILKYDKSAFIKLNQYGPKILLGAIALSILTNGKISPLRWFITIPAEFIVDKFESIAQTILFFL